MKIFKKTTIVLFLSTLFSSGFAQFNVNQDFIIAPASSPGCYTEIVNSQDESWQGGAFVINQTHDIYSPTDPDLEKTMRLQATRNVFFDIYHDTGSQLQFVKTVPFAADWLVADTGNCYSRASDLVGVPAGKTVIKLRLDIVHSENSPFPVDFEIELNGQPMCSYANFENTNLTCDLGQVECFYYVPCGEVQVNSQVNSCNPGGLSQAMCYEFSATVPNGSGNYTYNWSATQQNANWSSTSPVFTFQSSYPGHPVVILDLIDNVTGCEYYFNSSGKHSLVSGGQMENRLQAGPSPAIIGTEITLNYQTASKGNVTISLFDLEGREVQRIYSASARAAGNYKLKFVPDVPAGLYMISMRNADNLTTQKLLIQE